MNIINSNLQFKPLSYGNNPDTTVLHHSEKSICTIYDIHNWHLGNGWAGCGYQYFVRKNGDIYTGRPENALGAHCPNMNSHSIGICAEGNYMFETMPEAQKQAIIELCIYIKNKYGIQRILGHKEVPYPTDCPGTNYPLNEIRNAVSNGGSQPSQQTSTTPTHQENLLDKARSFVGSRCKELQEKLIALGYNCGGYGADGDFGQGTLDSLLKFQADNGLTQDALAGTLTFTKLDELVSQKNKPQPEPEQQGNDNVRALQHLCNILGVGDQSGYSLVEDGIVGTCTKYAVSHLPLCGIPYVQREATRYIQSKLNIGTDGVFGNQSSNAVKQWQSNHNLSCDGIVGSQTWLSFLN